MKSMDGLFAVTGILALCAGAASAQDHHQAIALPAAKVEVRSTDGRVTIPFRLVNNHVVIPIVIQGTRLEAVVDTGMPMDGLMLYRTAKVESLKLAPDKGMKVRVAGAGGDGAHVEADMVPGLTVDIEDLRLKDARAILAPPIHAMSAYHDGIIGASLFRNFVVAIDFDANRITLHDPKTWAPPENAVAVPLTLEHNFPFAEVVVLAPNGRRIPSRVVVDLGASHPISINAGIIEGLAVPPGAIRTIVGFGLGGMLRGQVGRVAGIEIGGIVLRDVIATFPDSEHQRPGGMESRGGNLGNGLLQHFNIAFDYAHSRMLLAPNKRFSEPFDWDMSGLWLQPDEHAALRIAHVVENSPAAEVGLAVGDIVTRVSGRRVAARDMPAIRQQMKQAGTNLGITLMRDGTPLEVTLRLKRLV